MRNLNITVAKKIFFIAWISAVILLPINAMAKTASASDPNNLLNIQACQNFPQDNSETETFNYVLNGQAGQVSARMFPGLVKCLNQLKMETSLPNATKLEREPVDDALVIANIPQTTSLQNLASAIQNATPNKDDQARITSNIVQGFKYEKNDKNDYNYPYEVAYDQKGICNETAKLIVSLLKQLGFGTALLTFDKDNHQVAGIKCDSQYSYQNTGYCFIEPTSRAIITDAVGEKEKAIVNVISDGASFDASKDYQDTQKFVELFEKRKAKKSTAEEDSAYASLKSAYGV